MSNSDFAIDVRGLRKSFGSLVAVKDLSMQVKKGHIYGFLGPNGSGKTTTIRMLCGLLTPDSGEGTCLGYDIRTESELIKQHIGYMTQKFSLYSDLSIKENLEFTARVFGVANPKAAARKAIDRLGLQGRENQLAGNLSGGWKQRLALGAAILPEPQLLLLDEPTAGVDPKARRDFWDEIHELAREGITVLVSTHYMDEAERCHEIAYLAYGDLLTVGTLDEIISESGLYTWEVSGEGVNSIAPEIRALPGCQMVAPFGSQLHVSGDDRQLLQTSISQLQARYPHLTYTEDEPTLEDVFIDLMSHSEDNV